MINFSSKKTKGLFSKIIIVLIIAAMLITVVAPFLN